MAADADVIVIGAGPGGLSCAAYLAAVGKRVVVVDRHTVPGGNMSCFTHRAQDGQAYEFDVGLHYLGGAGPTARYRRCSTRWGCAPSTCRWTSRATTRCCSTVARCASSVSRRG